LDWAKITALTMSIRLGHREASYIGGVDDVLAAFHLTKLEDSLLRHRGPLIQAACDDHRMGFQKSPAHPCQLTIQPVLSLQHLLQIEMRSRVTETGPSDCVVTSSLSFPSSVHATAKNLKVGHVIKQSQHSFQPEPTHHPPSLLARAKPRCAIHMMTDQH
jgi:hypothetical protein